MDTSFSTGGPLGEYTTDYVKALLIERRYIYAKLYNHGGSVILRASDVVDHDRPVGYSSQLGNAFHLDLIWLDQLLEQLLNDKHITRKELEAMLTWADGLTSQQAAEYLSARGSASVRKLRERGMRKVQEQLGNGENVGGTGNRTSPTRRQEA